jgi:uncharacterized protein (DUF486 family)
MRRNRRPKKAGIPWVLAWSELRSGDALLGCVRPPLLGFAQSQIATADAHRMKTVLLLTCSNIFMTLAWYGHLKFKFLEGRSIALAILVSWGIAFFEYCLMVPANRIGYQGGGFSGYQLKILQECITLVVFVGFAWFVLKERFAWNHGVSFGLILAAVWFATAFRPAS